eukprot:scaffold3799_cov168-Ochromonas_danica.AAC.7
MNFDRRALFVGDLPPFCSEQDVCSLFSPYGPVLGIQIHNRGKIFSYAFITLSSFESVEAARQYLDGWPFCGRRIKVRRATVARTKSMFGDAPPAANSVNRSITEFDLERVFGVYGMVEDVVIKDAMVKMQEGRQYGYAFIHFISDASGIQACVRVLNELNHLTVQGITFYLEPSRKLLQQLKIQESLRTAPPPSRPQMSGWSQPVFEDKGSSDVLSKGSMLPPFGMMSSPPPQSSNPSAPFGMICPPQSSNASAPFGMICPPQSSSAPQWSRRSASVSSVPGSSAFGDTSIFNTMSMDSQDSSLGFNTPLCASVSTDGQMGALAQPGERFLTPNSTSLPHSLL